MNIGFVSTWFERGAAYVTKAYLSLFENSDNVFVYARGGESFAKGDEIWDKDYVTWGKKLPNTKLNYKHFEKWILKNKLDVIFFNEQIDLETVAKIKKKYKNIKIGAYIDYYKENTIREFDIYDFLICNTKKHYSVFKKHKNCYYIPWGTDTNLFIPKQNETDNKEIKFFHSAGMSKRKGTQLVIEAFLQGKLYEKSKLIIHTQVPLEKICSYTAQELEVYNIEVIVKTVTAPGLYYLGDVYVYPTILEGIGLTIFEALSCGMPVITTNNAPMNEFINSQNGYLVDVEKQYCRADAYYWPVSICEIHSLIKAMEYYIKESDNINYLSKNIRQYAIDNLEWRDREDAIKDAFYNSNSFEIEEDLYYLLTRKNTFSKYMRLINDNLFPDFITEQLLKLSQKIKKI